MKVVIINGQNHKGSSYHMAHLLGDPLTNEITEFFLPKDSPHFCLGCYRCIEDDTNCPFYKEKQKILLAMEEADIFIFATPNYCMAPSGAMKSFLDLMFDYWMVHKPKPWMFYKKAIILSCSAGARCNSVIKVIKSSLSGWGISYIKSFSLPVNAKSWDEVPIKKKDKISKGIAKLSKVLKKNKPVRITLKTKLMFNIMRLLHIKGWDSSISESQYWDSYGWLDNNRPWRKTK